MRFSALMLRTPPTPEASKDLVESIVECCDELLGFIQDRLERSARESRGTRLTIQPIKFDEVLARVVQQNLPAAGLKRSVLDLVVGDRPPDTVMADYHGLCQVLDNLVSNALKFSPSGSRVTLTVEGLKDDPFLLVSVTDQGPGLTAEDRAHVFEPYRRLSAKPTGGEMSTGLGLSIARTLMERMGGAIGYDSLSGQGARFWIKIKRASQ